MVLTAGDQVVSCALRGGGGQDRSLKLQEAHAAHLVAQEADYLGTEHDIVVHFLVSEVEVAVLQADILAGLAGGSHFKRKLLRHLAEDTYFLSLDLDCTGFDLVVVGAFVAL